MTGGEVRGEGVDGRRLGKGNRWLVFVELSWSDVVLIFFPSLCAGPQEPQGWGAGGSERRWIGFVFKSSEWRGLFTMALTRPRKATMANEKRMLKTGLG